MVTFVRIDYWSADGWTTGHAGINLIDPQTYIENLGLRGIIARAVEPFTKTVIAEASTEALLEDLI